MEIKLGPDVHALFFGWPITNSLLVTWLVSLFLIVLAFFASRRMQTVPRGLQFWAEVILEGGESFMNSITERPKMTKKLFPFIMTLFLFYLCSNLFGLLPVLPIIEYHHHHLFRVPTTDFNIVFSLAMLGFVIMQTTAFTTGGLVLYIKKFFNWSSPINFFVGIMEAIGELSRIFSLSFRLFGNIFAEEVLAMVIMMLSPFLVPIPFSVLGLGVSLIQASVFPILMLIFIRLSALDEGGH